MDATAVDYQEGFQVRIIREPMSGQGLGERAVFNTLQL
jgi:hypothetical protein